MAKLSKNKQVIKEEVVKRLQKYIEYMNRNDFIDLEEGGDPLSLVYQDVRDSTPAERQEWLNDC